MTPAVERLRGTSLRLRRRILEMCAAAGTGRLTSSFSCVDILVALFHGGLLRFRPGDPAWGGRDRFIMSKGQAAPALYAVLADLGYFDPRELDRFAGPGGRLGALLQKEIPGAEVSSGSLGHGFGIAAGLALAAALNRERHRVVALLGDGECYEGAVWETAMFAASRRLRNLTAVVDRNGMCVSGFTERNLALEPLEEKWRAFGWETRRVDGHSFPALLAALRRAAGARRRPLAVIADTVKGKGLRRRGPAHLWHGWLPARKELPRCLREIERDHGNG